MSYTKADQLKKNCRLKPQPYKHSEYLSWLHAHDLTCFVCGRGNGIELHHVKRSSSDLKDDRLVIPLCGEEHHRTGTELSPHGNPKKWRETYPIEYQMAYAKKMYDLYSERL